MKTRRIKRSTTLRSKKDLVLVVFCFHKYNLRVKNFIEKAIFYDDHVKFIVVCNNPKLKIPVPSYVTYMNRENKGYDFGAWSHAILTDNLYKKYDKFIFVNSSVDGPYCNEKWTDVYLKELKGNVKLFGSTINCINNIEKCHVQSYIFCMDKKTLQFLIDKHIFSLTVIPNNFVEAIYLHEVTMSRRIIENGWNIGSFLTHYKGVDFTKPTKVVMNNDMMYEKFKNKKWTKEDLVFVKGNRIDCKSNCKLA